MQQIQRLRKPSKSQTCIHNILKWISREQPTNEIAEKLLFFLRHRGKNLRPELKAPSNHTDGVLEMAKIISNFTTSSTDILSSNEQKFRTDMYHALAKSTDDMPPGAALIFILIYIYTEERIIT